MTIAISGRRSTGRITVRWIETPKQNANPSVSTNAGQYETPWCISDHAM